MATLTRPGGPARAMRTSGRRTTQRSTETSRSARPANRPDRRQARGRPVAALRPSNWRERMALSGFCAGNAIPRQLARLASDAPVVCCPVDLPEAWQHALSTPCSLLAWRGTRQRGIDCYACGSLAHDAASTLKQGRARETSSDRIFGSNRASPRQQRNPTRPGGVSATGDLARQRARQPGPGGPDQPAS